MTRIRISENLEPMRLYCDLIEKSEIEKVEFQYLKELIPHHAQYFKFPIYDYRWASFYTKVASKTSIDKGDSERSPRQKRIDNFYGLMGEKAVKDILRKDFRLILHWNEREPKFFEQIYKEPFDIALPRKGGSYYTLEIKTTKEPSNHKNMIIPEGEWKKSDYAIAIKMLRFDLGKKRIAYGFFAGYLTKQEIENIPLTPYGEYPCLQFGPCRAKSLMELNPISKLWEKLKRECIMWESA